jgi:hypothetical protein
VAQTLLSVPELGRTNVAQTLLSVPELGRTNVAQTLLSVPELGRTNVAQTLLSVPELGRIYFAVSTSRRAVAARSSFADIGGLYAGIPVTASPMMRLWMSCVPS